MEGYDRLTPLMAVYPGIAIFRKFSILNYRMLMYLEAQLVEREGRLISAIKDDRNSKDRERMGFAFDFRAMQHPREDIEGAKRQGIIMDETGPILDRYSMSHRLFVGDLADASELLKLHCFARTIFSTTFLPFTSLTSNASGRN